MCIRDRVYTINLYVAILHSEKYVGIFLVNESLLGQPSYSRTFFTNLHAIKVGLSDRDNFKGLYWHVFICYPYAIHVQIIKSSDYRGSGYQAILF